MTETNAKLIACSQNIYTDDILYTWLLTFPRPILAEVNTHRVASRNTSSSRAIPSKKMRSNVLRDPFIPVSLGANQKGMQAGGEITGWRRTAIKGIIRGLRYPTVAAAWTLDKLGAHKQISNRYLEPWSWCNQVFSATDVNNIFLLRDHKMAEPHFQILAKQMHMQSEHAKQVFAVMKEHRMQSQSLHGVMFQRLCKNEWHLPFVDEEDWTTAESSEAYCSAIYQRVFSREWVVETLKKVSIARCARTSYKLLDTGKRSNFATDIALCEKLYGSDPKHLSPTEHVATPMLTAEYRGNFRGWAQARKFIVGEDGGDLRTERFGTPWQTYKQFNELMHKISDSIFIKGVTV